jgi:methionyl-tRNA formyltransferase
MLTCDQPWQRTFAARLAAKHELALVVVDQHLSAASRARRIAGILRHPNVLVRKVIGKLSLRSIERRESAVYQSYFDSIGSPPFEQSCTRIFRAQEINSAEVSDQINSVKPDAILISGTRLIRAPVLECTSEFGLINMHTGLSPYYRGGPCTFWTLYNEQPEYAGVTIHYLSAGIDSGDIILSGRPQLDVSDGVASLDCKVIDLGHKLMLRALELIMQGRAPRVPAWERGKLFLYKMYTAKVRRELEAKLRNGLMERCLLRLQQNAPHLRTIDTES